MLHIDLTSNHRLELPEYSLITTHLNATNPSPIVTTLKYNPAVESATNERPNVVILLADDLGERSRLL